MFKALWANMAEATGVEGVWGFSRGGMGAITQAMAASAEARGATIRTGTEIEEILIEDDRATGVVLTSGETIRARAVASNADPKRTFLKLVPGGHLEPSIKRDVNNLKLRGNLAKVFIALDARPEWSLLQRRGPRDTGPRIHRPGAIHRIRRGVSGAGAQGRDAGQNMDVSACPINH